MKVADFIQWGLKIPRWKRCAGSSPALGTKNSNEIPEFFKMKNSGI